MGGEGNRSEEFEIGVQDMYRTEFRGFAVCRGVFCGAEKDQHPLNLNAPGLWISESLLMLSFPPRESSDPDMELPASLCSLRYLLFKVCGLIFLPEDPRLLTHWMFNLPKVLRLFGMARAIELRAAFAYFVFKSPTARRFDFSKLRPRRVRTSVPPSES